MILGAAFNRLGLWHHCFRSLPDPSDEYHRRFFAGCRWIYDPFTTGYDQIRGYLVPSNYSSTFYRSVASKELLGNISVGEIYHSHGRAKLFAIVLEFLKN